MIMCDSANCFSAFLLVLLSIIIVDNAEYTLCLHCSLCWFGIFYNVWERGTVLSLIFWCKPSH